MEFFTRLNINLVSLWNVKNTSNNGGDNSRVVNFWNILFLWEIKLGQPTTTKGRQAAWSRFFSGYGDVLYDISDLSNVKYFNCRSIFDLKHQLAYACILFNDSPKT